MLRNVFNLVAVMVVYGLLSGTSYAMQLNVNVGDDIKNNRDKLSFSYDLYYNVSTLSQQHTSNKMSGISAEMVSSFIERLENVFSDIQPVDSIDGKHSEIAFGYKKNDGTEVYPASCQNIIAKPIMNVLFSETGCVVN